MAPSDLQVRRHFSCGLGGLAGVPGQRGPALIPSLETLARGLTLLLQLLLNQLPLRLPVVSERPRLLRLVHLLLRDALVLRTRLPLVHRLLRLPLPVSLSILLFVLAVCLLLSNTLLALIAGIRH